jgi:hypothetical protein
MGALIPHLACGTEPRVSVTVGELAFTWKCSLELMLSPSRWRTARSPRIQSEW